ncbi:MAG TPA: hypothetical protein VMZ28_03605 [Kofleriaceae bacterium]|nr:hypothetical protein [Kofleriaceae bacterium]
MAQVAARESAYEEWVARVAELARAKLGKGLDAFPGLPLRAGFECGDSPLEFFAGCLEESTGELDAWRECFTPPG